MGIGTGVLLIALGAVLAWGIDVDLPLIDDDGMGLILVFAGIAILLISVILRANRPSAGIGTGVGLIVAGSVVAWAIDIDVPFITDSVFGGILITAGLIALVSVVAINVMHRRAARPPQPYDEYPPQAYDEYPPRPRESYPPRPYDNYPPEPRATQPYDSYRPQSYEPPQQEAAPPQPPEPSAPPSNQPRSRYYAEPTQVFEQPRDNQPPPPPQR